MQVHMCKLCGRHDPLQRSHIIPEFAYKPIYDKKHRGLIFDPLAPDRARKFQKGLREPMLCRKCEGFLNDKYEKPFKRYWYDENPLAPLENRSGGLILKVPDYASFKLFHLSVLLRADFSKLFWEARLGARHRARLREMVRDGNPGEAHEYPIMCMAIEMSPSGEIWWELVSSPNPGRVDGMRFYQFTFAGCGWMYFVSSHRQKAIERGSLRTDGTLPVLKKPWAALKRFSCLDGGPRAEPGRIRSGRATESPADRGG